MTDVLAVPEHRRGELRDVSYQLVTAGRELAAATGGDLHLGIVGGTVERFADALDREGVSAIHTVASGEEFNHDVYTQSVGALAEALEASIVVLPHSANGLDFAPALAEDLGATLLPDVAAVEIDGGVLAATRGMYGSKVEATVEVAERPVVITIRAGEWPEAEGVGGADVEAFDFAPDDDAIGSRVTGYEETPAGDVDIADADVLVAVGRGIGEEGNLEIVEELAAVTGATLAASRPVVDKGWLPKNRQVGQSGKTVSPEVYLAVGISGAVQHVAGMKGAETIIAVNTDPNAPIFDVADYGIVGDLFDVLPALVAELG